jgi:hypothetical protein
LYTDLTTDLDAQTTSSLASAETLKTTSTDSSENSQSTFYGTTTLYTTLRSSTDSSSADSTYTTRASSSLTTSVNTAASVATSSRDASAASSSETTELTTGETSTADSEASSDLRTAETYDSSRIDSSTEASTEITDEVFTVTSADTTGLTTADTSDEASHLYTSRTTDFSTDASSERSVSSTSTDFSAASSSNTISVFSAASTSAKTASYAFSDYVGTQSYADSTTFIVQSKTSGVTTYETTAKTSGITTSINTVDASQSFVGSTSIDSTAEVLLRSSSASSTSTSGRTVGLSTLRATRGSTIVSSSDSSAEDVGVSSGFEVVRTIDDQSAGSSGETSRTSMEDTTGYSVRTSNVLTGKISFGEDSNGDVAGTLFVTTGVGSDSQYFESTNEIVLVSSADSSARSQTDETDYISEDSSAESKSYSSGSTTLSTQAYASERSVSYSDATSIGSTSADTSTDLSDSIEGTTTSEASAESTELTTDHTTDLSTEDSSGITTSVYSTLESEQSTKYTSGSSTRSSLLETVSTSQYFSSTDDSDYTLETSSDITSAATTRESTNTAEERSTVYSTDISTVETSEESTRSTLLTTSYGSSQDFTEQSVDTSSDHTTDASALSSFVVQTQVSYDYATDAPLASTSLSFTFVQDGSYTKSAFLNSIATVAQCSVSDVRLQVLAGPDADGRYTGRVHFVSSNVSLGYVHAHNFFTYVKNPAPTKRDNILASFDIRNLSYFSFADPDLNNCPSDDDTACGGMSNGYCYDTQKTGWGICDCASGAIGLQCTNGTATGWNPDTVEDTAAKFHPNFDFVAADSVTFTIMVPSVEVYDSANPKSHGTTTFITFGADNFCNYPNNPNWVISANAISGSSFTNDVYTATFSYLELINCGLTQQTAVNDTWMIYSSKVQVTRKFNLVKGNFNLERTASNSYAYSILFPLHTSVQTTIDVVDNELVQFLALTVSSFDIVADQWTIIFTALTRAPYQLNTQTAVATTTPSGYPRVVAADSYTVSGCMGGPNVEDNCRQEITVVASGCDVLDFQLSIQFDIDCRTPNPFSEANPTRPCIAASPSSVTPVFNILTSSSCPIEKESPIKDKIMLSYEDEALALSQTFFGRSHTIYFAVGFDSPAVITDVTLENVCVKTVGAALCENINKVDLKSTMDTAMLLSDATTTDAPIRSSFSILGEDIHSKITLKHLEFTSIVVRADFTVTYGNGFQKRTSFYGTATTATQIRITADADVNNVSPSGPAKATKSDPSSASFAAVSLALIAVIVVALV